MPFYTANTPGANDPINITQPLIEANFQQLDIYTQVDHVALNAANQGKHNQVTMPVQTLPTTVSGEGALYTKAGSSGTELWFVRDGNLGTNAVALTSSGVTVPIRATKGYTYLPGNILMKWGTIVSPPSGTQTYTYSPDSPDFVNDAAFIPVVMLTAVQPALLQTQIKLISSSYLNFVYSTSQVATVYWTAIGPI